MIKQGLKGVNLQMAALRTALYMLAVMAAGAWTTRRVPERELVVAQLNKMVFSVFLPLMVFQNIYTTDFGTVFDGKLLGCLALFLTLTWLALMVLSPRWISDRKTCGAFIQSSLRGNSILMGIPVAGELFAGQPLGGPTVITALITICCNIIGVITLEIYRGQTPSPKKIAGNLLKNPVLIAGAAAVALLPAGLRLPGFLEKTVESLAGMASPMGLLLIGASLRPGFWRVDRTLGASLLLKLVVIPAFGMTGAVLLGWRGIELCTALIVTASPTAVSAYSMAQVMESDSGFTAKAVGMSSVLGAGTVFLWTALLEALQLL